MNKKRAVIPAVLAALASWSITLISVSYQWGYDQSAIDHKVAAFSYPACLNLLNGIPGIIATAAFLGLIFYLYRKK